MKKIVDYRIVEDADKQRLEKNIVICMQKYDYVLQGGISVVYNENGGYYLYAQAIVKYEDDFGDLNVQV